MREDINQIDIEIAALLVIGLKTLLVFRSPPLTGFWHMSAKVQQGLEELPPRLERRASRRRRVLFSGALCSLDGARCYDCAIRDMTELGAHVVVPNSPTLDAQLFLLHVRDGVVHEALVVAKEHNSVSLKFISAIPLANNDDAKMRWLKDLWRSRRGY